MYGSVSSATQPSFVTKNEDDWQSGDAAGIAAYRYMDLAQCSSLVNRRTYRSGMLYPFSIEVIPQTDANYQAKTIFKVEVLPNTFIVRHSFKLAKEAFLKATEEEREMVKSARWNDFRVFFDESHKTKFTTGSQNILPKMVMTDETSAMDTGYEYSYLSNRDSPGDDQYFGFLGTGDAEYLAMMQEYYISLQATQAVPDPPVTISTLPYDSIIEQVDPEDAEALQSVNEYPPYDEYLLQTNIQEYYIGIQNGNSPDIPAVPLSTSTPIILAPCGLIRIKNLSVDSSNDPLQMQNVAFRVNMLNGNYRGLEAGKMI